MIFKHKKHEVLVQLSQSWQVLVVFVILKIALSGSIHLFTKKNAVPNSVEFCLNISSLLWGVPAVPEK